MNVETGLLLVVDDNEMNRDLLARRLERQGHRIVTAENGREALNLMKAQQFDLVLLDIMMPVMNGFEVLGYVKSDPELRHTPVIVISAAEDMENVIKCIELGAEDYLTKPYNAPLLKARIGACLEKKYLHDKQQAFLTELAVMQQIDRELNATLDVRRAMEIALDWALRQSGDEAGVMGVLKDGRFHLMAAHGYSYELSDTDENSFVPAEIPAVQAVLDSGELEIVHNTNGAGILARTRSQLAVPIRRESAVLAILLLENTKPKQWNEQITNFLNRLTNHAAIAIANAQLYETVQSANNAKTEFVSFVSHELKIPMTSIKGYADLLLSANFGGVNDVQANFLKTIRSNVDRMARLVSDLTDISRIEAGHLHLETRALSLKDVVEEVMQSTQAQIAEKEQSLVLEIPSDLPPIWGDRTRLIQILTNLVSNAYKYTPEKGRITVRAEVINSLNGHQEMHPMMHVSVEDTGLGIKEEDQASIFSKFFRANDEQAQRAPGTGLGLNITKNLVEMHDGRIWFESKFREGTTFHFVIPVAAR